MGVCIPVRLRADFDRRLEAARFKRVLIAQGRDQSVMAQWQTIERIGDVHRHFLAFMARGHVIFGRFGCIGQLVARGIQHLKIDKQIN